VKGKNALLILIAINKGAEENGKYDFANTMKKR
jgi:hypothetical protein